MLPPARDQFLVILLRDTGLRIGEALGLRRADMHLLPDPRGLGCTVVGAHVHVRHRANRTARWPSPGSRAPCRPATRCSPPTPATSTSGPCWPARTEPTWCWSTSTTIRSGAPMTYRAAKGWFERVAAGCGFPVRPHMLRHTAATNWVRAGVDLDVVQALLGHASLASRPSTCMPGMRTSAARWRPWRRGSGTGERTRAAGCPPPPGAGGATPRAGPGGRKCARLDPGWRAGEWDGETLLFTGDLDSARTAAWPCRTPGCPTATRRPSGRCDGCRRARVEHGPVLG